MENITESLQTQEKILFSGYDYILFSIMLGLSVLIGIWFGFVKRQTTKNDYLFGGRTMPVLPIALSLIASNISGLALLGIPVDIYMYGIQYVLVTISILLVGIAIYFIYAPVFYKLQVISCYEYIELRFNKKLRILSSLLYTLNILMYLPIVVYVPALAFAYAASVNVHWVTPIICGVCIFYTTIGGLKAVVWADTLQFGVMLGSTITVVYLGVASAGGFDNIWRNASAGQRLDFDFDLNPTKRDTVFTIFFGLFFTFLGIFSINQAFVQRYNALPSYNDVKWAIFLFISGTVAFMVLAVLTGLVVYAKYAHCDPFTAGHISKKDEIVPYYILNISKTLPGLAGLFIAGVFSAALSTLSSYLNSLAVIIYEDLILQFMPKDTTEKTTSNILKLIVTICGIITIVLVLFIEKMGDILAVYFILNGIIGGQLIGIFTLGMLFPCVNSKGTLLGTIISFITMSYIIIQSQIYQSQGYIKYAPKSVSIDGCQSHINTTIESKDNLMNSFEPFFIFRISHYYYTAMGMFIVILIALPASFIFKNENEKVNKSVISPLVHWTMKQERRHVDYTSVETLNTPPLEK